MMMRNLPFGPDGCACTEAGAVTAAGTGVAGCWNILVNSPGWPGAGESTGAAAGTVAGFWKARVNAPGCGGCESCEAADGAGIGFDSGTATGSGAWRN